MKNTALCKRLGSAVKYVRRGAVFADIGTDHAYLPIYLLKEGTVDRAILSDINEGPLLSARQNARDNGVLSKVELVLTDGAAALDGRGITDVAIFGMGGELIRDIIERAPFLKNAGMRLILQPMTKQTLLCTYLIDAGFSFVGETYTRDAGKFYRTVCVEPQGEKPPENFAEIGFSTTPCEEIEAKIGYLTTRLSSLERAVFGKKSVGADFSEEERRANIIKGELERLKGNKRNDS